MFYASTSAAVDRIVIEEDTYTMTLKRVFCRWGNPTQFAPDGAAKIAFVWEYIDESGETHELSDWHNFPKNFRYNEKGAFWKRIGEIAGIVITNENAALVGVDLGRDIKSFADLVTALQSSEKNLDVSSLKVGDVELIGATRRLVVGVWERNGRTGNSVDKVMQMKGNSKMPPPQEQLATAEGMPF